MSEILLASGFVEGTLKFKELINTALGHNEYEHSLPNEGYHSIINGGVRFYVEFNDMSYIPNFSTPDPDGSYLITTGYSGYSIRVLFNNNARITFDFWDNNDNDPITRDGFIQVRYLNNRLYGEPYFNENIKINLICNNNRLEVYVNDSVFYTSNAVVDLNVNPIKDVSLYYCGSTEYVAPGQSYQYLKLTTANYAIYQTPYDGGVWQDLINCGERE